MSDSSPAEGQVKADEVRKHTLLWDAADWDRIEEAARRLSEVTKATVKVPDFIRGATMARADEVLGASTPSQAAA